REVMARALGEIQQEIEDRKKQAIDTALAGVRGSIEGLRQEITKRETIDTGAIVELPNPLARHAPAKPRARGGSDLQQLCHAIAALCRDDAELRGKARARGARPGGGDYAHQQLGRGGAARWPRTTTR